MFKDYTHLENQIGSKDSIERQAYLHGKLTNYLNNINKLLGIADLKEEVATRIKEEITQPFN